MSFSPYQQFEYGHADHVEQQCGECGSHDALSAAFMQAEYEYPYDHAERSAYELPPDDLRDEEHDAYEDNDTGYDPAEVCVCQSEHDFLQ